MPTYSQRSLDRLKGIHPDLITLFAEMIVHRDCSIICGLRIQEEQQALYAKGRTVKGDVVTYLDGVTKRSKHQDGLACDVIPYPEGYDEEACKAFGELVVDVAVMLKENGKIDSEITWGGSWRWKDFPHYEIKSS